MFIQFKLTPLYRYDNYNKGQNVGQFSEIQFFQTFNKIEEKVFQNYFWVCFKGFF